MNQPITITEVIARSEQGATRPFFCYADSGSSHRMMYSVKGAYAGKNSLCCEWVASRLAHLLVDRNTLDLPQFRMADVPAKLVDASARPDIQDLGTGLVFASLLIISGQELTWSDAQDWPTETMAMLLLLDLWLQNEDRSLSEHGGNPNLLLERGCSLPNDAVSKKKPHLSRLWAYDYNLAFDVEFDRGRFFDAHVFGRILKRWPDGFRKRMEPRMRLALGQVRTIFSELPLNWLYVDGDDSLPMQLDENRVLSVLELPFSDPDHFWKLP